MVGDHRRADPLGHRRLIPRLADRVAINRAGLQRRRHLRRRRHGNQHIAADLARDIGGTVKAGVDATRRQPVAQLVIMRRDRKDHAEVEGRAGGGIGLDHRLQGRGGNRMRGLAALHRHMRLHRLPDRIRHGDGVAVQVHREGRDHRPPGAITDRRRDRLAGQHMRPVEFARDHPVKQDLPVRLRLQRDIQPLVLEKPLFPRDRQRRHVGQLDETKRQFILFDSGGFGEGRKAQGRRDQQGGNAGHGLGSLVPGLRR